MRIYLRQNVLDAAKDRIRWLFDEFENLVVCISGGKDSTVIFHLCLEIAREKNRLPLRVMFIDQEAEWGATIDIIRASMYHPDVSPHWLQVPIRLFNATSTQEHWLKCWSPEDEPIWMRPRDPIALTENVYGTDRFAPMYAAYLRHHYPDAPAAFIGGVRCEESPVRALGITSYPTYKGATWGNVKDKRRQHFSFYPLYDWSYTDVWAAIARHGWPYNRIYDLQYQHGVGLMDMRVSNVHHETAISNLWYAQEAEPDTYERLTRRLAGIDMACKFGTDDFFQTALPPVFGSWAEYRDYLLTHLITKPEWRDAMRKKFDEQEAIFGPTERAEPMRKMHVNAILRNDWECITPINWYFAHKQYVVRKRLAGKETY